MFIKVKIADCTHLEKMSRYNKNYYELPREIKGCTVLFESFDLGDIFNGNQIGNIINDEFEPVYWLHTEDHFDSFIIDTTEMATFNKWT